MDILAELERLANYQGKIAEHHRSEAIRLCRKAARGELSLMDEFSLESLSDMYPPIQAQDAASGGFTAPTTPANPLGADHQAKEASPLKAALQDNVKKICFYHGVDLDGKCSGAIFAKAMKAAGVSDQSVKLTAYNYNDEILVKDIAGCDAYFIDCSPQPLDKWLPFLFEHARNVHIIDHHLSLLNNPLYKDAVSSGKLKTYSRVGIGACALAWEHFFNAPLPKAVQLLAEYDAWVDSDKRKWENEIMPFQYGARILDLDPRKKSNEWSSLFDSDARVDEIISKGQTILAYERKRLHGLSKSCSFEANINGHSAICINSESKSSMTLEKIFDPSKHEIMCVYNQVPDKTSDGDLKYLVSFYSSRADVDCSQIAKFFGGGGHKGAAGCQVKEIMLVRGMLILK